MTSHPIATPTVPRRLRRTYRISESGLGWEHRCSSCHRWYPATPEYFQQRRRSSTGLGALCHACNRRRQRSWQIDHPSRAYDQLRRYRRRQASAPGRFTERDRAELLERYGHRCVACGRHQDELDHPIGMDHITPPQLGGSNSPHNRQPLCRACNARKGTSTVDYRPLHMYRLMTEHYSHCAQLAAQAAQVWQSARPFQPLPVA